LNLTKKFTYLLFLLLFPVLSVRAETPVEARAAYIMEVADSLVKARLALFDQSIMEHRFDKSVKRRIENYVGNWSHATARVLARSARFFPIFEEQLAAKGMPLGLKYVTIQESALRPYATSHAGAGGLWQLMPGTAREHGLTVEDYLDERLDPELGCAAGLEYLQIQYNRYEDWALALAAYNCGPGNVNKALRRAGGKNKSYWQIRRHLPRETRNYLPNIIAAAYVMAFHHLHDVPAAPMDLDLQITEAITVERKLSLHRVIQVTGLRPDVVIELNAQYLKGYLPGLSGGHRLRLPKRVMPAMRSYLALHPAAAPETDADLPWASPLLNNGALNTERHYSQYRTTVGSQDTTLRQVANTFQTPVDQLAVWSNRGEFDSLALFDEIVFYNVSEYRPYDPRDRNTPPAVPMVEMLPAAPVRIPDRKITGLPEVKALAPLEKRKPGLRDILKSWF
jgi:membrane-bound lytic murein transglycosylase D